MAHEPGKIRNVAVVGHRGTGKTSLVEAMLFQAGATNRLGTIEAGTTVSDWDEDEQRRQMSLAASLAHARVAGPEDQPDRHARRRRLPGRRDRGAARRRGRARRRQRRHGRRGAARRASGSAPTEVDLSRVALREHARPRARRLLPRARRARRSSSREHCVAVHLPIGAEHELTGIVDLLHMCAYMSPGGRSARASPSRFPPRWQTRSTSTARSCSTPSSRRTRR